MHPAINPVGGDFKNVDSIGTWTTLLFQSKLADFRVSAKRFPTEFHSAGDVNVSEITLR